MRRRGFIGTTGLATISFAGAHVPLGILSAGAQARAPGDEHVWMAPSRVTLFQSFMTVAEAKGWFREEGVNVKVQPGTGTAAAVQQVATGGTAFGMAAPVATCGPIADQDAPIVTIGQVAYRGFFEIASRADRPLRHPSDFQGKTIGILSVGGTTDLQLDAMSIAVGLDPTKVRKVVTGIGLTGLLPSLIGDGTGTTLTASGRGTPFDSPCRTCHAIFSSGDRGERLYIPGKSINSTASPCRVKAVPVLFSTVTPG